MAITATTLSAAVAATDAVVNVASATGITAPNFTVGTGITYLEIDQEILLVLGVSGTVVTVQRGFAGTSASAHTNGSQVQVGLPADFPAQYFLRNLLAAPLQAASFQQPAIFLSGAADVIPATVPGFYVVKTAGVDAMTLAVPPASAEGNIISIWSDTTNAHTLTCPSAVVAIGVALKTVGTFTAFRGCGVTLRVCNGVYHLVGGSGPTAASFVTWA